LKGIRSLITLEAYSFTYIDKLGHKITPTVSDEDQIRGNSS